MDSLIHGFHKMSIEERRNIIREFSNLSTEDMEAMDYRMDTSTAGNMIENVYTIMDYPVGIATNFRINDREYLIPMSLEYPLLPGPLMQQNSVQVPHRPEYLKIHLNFVFP